MRGVTLPVDIWLLVFEEMDDVNILWSHVRNVSHLLRAYIDEFFRHGVIQNTFIDLHYSDIHTSSGPTYGHIHVPMVFDRWSEDGRRAVFQQRAYKEYDWPYVRGSVRGWVPFIDRYHEETQRGRLEVLNKSKADVAPPLWERDYMYWRNTLNDDHKRTYLKNLSIMTSIGRGDRPPFFINVFNSARGVKDTDIVDIVVNCEKHEVSFDWRQTYTFFFREDEFERRASDAPPNKCHYIYDKELNDMDALWMQGHRKNDHTIRARQKRLSEWYALNKHRMSPEHRMWTQERAYTEGQRLGLLMRRENLIPVPIDGSNGDEEIVPETCAETPTAIRWEPWADVNAYYAQPHKVKMKGLCCCCTFL